MHLEEKPGTKPEKPAAPEAEEEEPACHICGEELTASEQTKCSGCDGITCDDCMGDDGVCGECEGEQ